jgi:hypothetical protein
MFSLILTSLFSLKLYIFFIWLCSITDEEYIQFAVAEGKRFQDSFEIIALLKKSYESYGDLKVQRMGSFCGFQMAREYYAAGDFTNAKQLFDDIASLYRREGWVILLWEVLGYLRECARKRGTVKEFVEYSLEMAALPVSSGIDTQSLRFKECGPAGPASLAEREVIHKEVFGLVCGESELPPVESSNNLQITGDNPLHLEIDLVSPLRLVLLASVAFHEQIIKPSVSTLITISLLSQLPVSVEIDQLEMQFNQSDCNFIIVNAQRPSSVATSDDKQGHRVETSSSLALATNKWLRFTYDIKSGKSVTTSAFFRVLVVCFVQSLRVSTSGPSNTLFLQILKKPTLKSPYIRLFLILYFKENVIFYLIYFSLEA